MIATSTNVGVSTNGGVHRNHPSSIRDFPYPPSSDPGVPVDTSTSPVGIRGITVPRCHSPALGIREAGPDVLHQHHLAPHGAVQGEQGIPAPHRWIKHESCCGSPIGAEWAYSNADKCHHSMGFLGGNGDIAAGKPYISWETPWFPLADYHQKTNSWVDRACGSDTPRESGGKSRTSAVGHLASSGLNHGKHGKSHQTLLW